MKYTIDRFEGDYAVVELESGNIVNIPKITLPSNAKESDIISVEVDETTTKNRSILIKDLMNDVWND